MGATLATIHRAIQQIKHEMLFLRHIMEDDYELSEEAKKQLELARMTPRSAYLSHKAVKKRLCNLS